jgi:hypothetical protein
LLLKCLLLICGLVLVSIMYAIIKSGWILCICYLNESMNEWKCVCSVLSLFVPSRLFIFSCWQDWVISGCCRVVAL